MNLYFRIISAADNLLNYEAKNVFQTMEWIEIYSMDRRYEAVFCTLMDENNNVVMLQPLLFVKLLPLGRYGRIAIAWDEPLYSGNDEARDGILLLMLKEIESYCKKKAIMLEYRHWRGDECFVKLFRKAGYSAIEWYNVINYYNKFDGEVDKMLSSKRLQKIRSEIKRRVEVVDVAKEEELRGFYILLREHYEKIRRPLPRYEVFAKSVESGLARCIIAKKDGCMLAGVIVLFLRGKEACMWYNVVDKKIKKNNKSGLVVMYEAMKLAKDYRVESFNFLGGGRRGKSYGVRDFKLKFGGDLVEEWRFRKLLI